MTDKSGVYVFILMIGAKLLQVGPILHDLVKLKKINGKIIEIQDGHTIYSVCQS